MTAKAHGGSIEIFGVTVATVDDKVRLQAVHTWMDPLAMFRQIAPHGVVNKQAVDGEVQVDPPPHLFANTDGSDKGEAPRVPAYINGDEQITSVVLARKDGSPDSSEQTGGTCSVQTGVCPFIPQSDATPVLAASQDERQSESTDANVDQRQHHQSTVVSMPLPTESLLPVSMAPITTANTFQSQSDEPGNQASSDGYKRRSMIEADEKRPCKRPRTQDEAQRFHIRTTDMKEQAGSRTQHIPQDVGNAISSLTSVGDGENTQESSATEHFAQGMNSTPVRPDVDEYLERSAYDVHPHPKDVEEAVEPAVGEAVAAAAGSEETRQSKEEMGQTTSEELEMIMNRE